MSSSSFLPLQTASLELRPFERRDFDAVARYHTLPAVQRYVERSTRYGEDVMAAVMLMRNQVSLQRPGDTLTLAMTRRGDRRLVGQVSLTWADATAGQGEIRFVIDPAWSGNGYLKQALTAVLGLAFEQFHLHRVAIRCDGRCHHSAKLLQQLGMRLEAHYREHALFQGEWDEELLFAMLDREWRPSAQILELPRRDRVA